MDGWFSLKRVATPSCQPSTAFVVLIFQQLLLRNDSNGLLEKEVAIIPSDGFAFDRGAWDL